VKYKDSLSLSLSCLAVIALQILIRQNTSKR
jgi:hypothetical protein